MDSVAVNENLEDWLCSFNALMIYELYSSVFRFST